MNRKLGDTEHGSLQANEATIGGVASNMHWDQVVAPTDNSSVSVAGDDNHVYRVVYRATIENSTGQVVMRLNGDSSSNSDYTYWRINGTRQDGSSGFVLFEPNTSANSVCTGWVDIRYRAWLGMNHHYIPTHASRIDTISEAGNRQVAEALSSVDLDNALDYSLAVYESVPDLAL